MFGGKPAGLSCPEKGKEGMMPKEVVMQEKG